MSEAGATKSVPCIACGINSVEMSLYASPKKAVCDSCGGKSNLVKPNAVPTSEISKDAKKHVARPMTKDMKAIREMIREELDQYDLWEWMEIPVLDFKLKDLNALGAKGWKFAFTNEERVLLHRIKK